jgi:hypothetical protein
MIASFLTRNDAARNSGRFSQLVGSWKTITKGRRTHLEVTMLDPHPVLADDLFADAIAATEQVLDLTITDLRVHPPLR